MLNFRILLSKIVIVIELNRLIAINSPCAVSIAFLGHEFIHFIQLSHLKVQ